MYDRSTLPFPLTPHLFPHVAGAAATERVVGGDDAGGAAAAAGQSRNVW